MEALTVLTFVLAFLLFGWGYQIGVGQRSSLVPGNIPVHIRNRRGYLQWIGMNLMIAGTLGLVDGLFQLLFPLTHGTMFLAYVGVILPILGVRILLGGRRYILHEMPGGQGG